MSLTVMLTTAVGIILLLGLTVWQRMLNNREQVTGNRG
jgi:UDP-GlcNAc:undecaprenyl-phosphate GlcNAc-1-phosphate transferase